MSFSISKLQNLIQSNGFIIKSYFTMDGMCFYIELYSTLYGDTFFLYIPSKYNFSMKEDDNTFKMKYINNKDLENIDENGIVEEQYGNNVLALDSNNIEEQLEDNYKHSISIKNISLSDLFQIKNVFKQVNRLRYSVQNLKYKLGIQFKNYFCSIRRDDTINCFFLKHYKSSTKKRLIIIVDLETFYLRLDKIQEDISTIKHSIYKILNKNQSINTDTLNKMFESNSKSSSNQMIQISQQIAYKHFDYINKIQSVENMLNTMIEAQKTLGNSIKNLETGSPIDNFNTDVNRIYKKNQIEKELEKILRIRQELLSVSIQLKEECDNNFLNVDNILFDNSVMLERIIKNFSALQEFC